MIAPAFEIENIESVLPAVMANKVGVSPDVATVQTAALFAALSVTEHVCDAVTVTPTSVTVTVIVCCADWPAASVALTVTVQVFESDPAPQPGESKS